MKATAALIVILLIYTLFSYLVHRLLLRSKWLMFIIIVSVYVILSNYYFDFVTYAHQNLRLKEIYFEFGHGDVLLLAVYAICILLALFNIVFSIVRKRKKEKGLY